MGLTRATDALFTRARRRYATVEGCTFLYGGTPAPRTGDHRGDETVGQLVQAVVRWL